MMVLFSCLPLPWGMPYCAVAHLSNSASVTSARAFFFAVPLDWKIKPWLSALTLIPNFSFDSIKSLIQLNNVGLILSLASNSNTLSRRPWLSAINKILSGVSLSAIKWLINEKGCFNLWSIVKSGSAFTSKTMALDFCFSGAGAISSILGSLIFWAISQYRYYPHFPIDDPTLCVLMYPDCFICSGGFRTILTPKGALGGSNMTSWELKMATRGSSGSHGGPNWEPK